MITKNLLYFVSLGVLLLGYFGRLQIENIYLISLYKFLLHATVLDFILAKRFVSSIELILFFFSVRNANQSVMSHMNPTVL